MYLFDLITLIALFSLLPAHAGYIGTDRSLVLGNDALLLINIDK